MFKSTDYDEKIALCEQQLRELKYERRKLRDKEERSAVRQLRIQNNLLRTENATLERQNEAMKEWLMRTRKLASGKTFTLSDCFVQSYPEYDYLFFRGDEKDH